MGTWIREGIDLLRPWAIVFLLLQFPTAMLGVKEMFLLDDYGPQEFVPEVLKEHIIFTQPHCKYEDDLTSIFLVQYPRLSLQYTFKKFMSPYYVRNSRLLNKNGTATRVSFQHSPVLDRQLKSMLYGMMGFFPVAMLLTFIPIVLIGTPGGNFAKAFGHFIWHPIVRDWFRDKSMKREKWLRQVEIDFTPDFSKIEREFRMFVLFRRTDEDSEPQEMKDFDFNLLVHNKRIIIDPPMMTKFAYYFDRKNLWLDPENNMIMPRPEPEAPYAMTFEELQTIKAEQAHMDKETKKVGEERVNYAKARRLVYNIPKVRFYAITQGLPYKQDLNRHEIMLQVKKARRDMKRKVALAAGKPDPFRSRKIADWTTKIKLARRKGRRPKPKPVIPPDEPNEEVRSIRYFSPSRFDPTVAGGGFVTEWEHNEKQRQKEERALRMRYIPTPEEIEQIKREVHEEMRKASLKQREAEEEARKTAEANAAKKAAAELQKEEEEFKFKEEEDDDEDYDYYYDDDDDDDNDEYDYEDDEPA